MLRSQFQLIALFGQPSQLVVRREILRRQVERLRPTLNPRRQRTVDILKGLLRSGPRHRIAGDADAVEHAPRLRLHVGLVTQKRELQRRLEIGRIDPHRRGKLVPRRLVLPHLQVAVSQVFANGSPAGRRVYAQ